MFHFLAWPFYHWQPIKHAIGLQLAVQVTLESKDASVAD